MHVATILNKLIFKIAATFNKIISEAHNMFEAKMKKATTTTKTQK